MALGSMLSAMKEIVLYPESIPEEGSERASYFRRQYPDLSSEEVQDLVSLPRDRMQTYTRSIYSGERGIISNHYGMTLQLIERAWGAAYKDELSSYSFVKAFQKKHPWKSYRTEAFLEDFKNYCALQSDLITQEPAIADCALFEYANFLIKRLKPAFSLPDVADPAKLKLTNLTVEELLALKFSLSPFAHFLELSYDINSAFAFYRANNKELPNKVIAIEHKSIGVRNAEGLARWHALKDSSYKHLQHLSSGKISTLEELAGCFAKDIVIDSEEELFLEFLCFCSALISDRAILIRA